MDSGLLGRQVIKKIIQIKLNDEYNADINDTQTYTM